MFTDRQDSGKQLARALKSYVKQPNTLVIGLPRGGVVTAYEVAQALELPLDVLCPRKIGAPSNPEYAIGAITETGEGIFNEEAIATLGISQQYLDKMVANETAIAQERVQQFREGRVALDCAGKQVIVVDDGMATGLTMKATILSLRKANASQIIVAVPVAPPDTLVEIEAIADKVICLAAPLEFYAVGQFYREFGQTSSQEVIELLRQAHTL